jgi:hypothetical protein
MSNPTWKLAFGIQSVEPYNNLWYESYDNVRLVATEFNTFITDRIVVKSNNVYKVGPCNRLVHVYE